MNQAAVVVPFGKYKGATVADLLEKTRPIAPESGRVSQRLRNRKLCNQSLFMRRLRNQKKIGGDGVRYVLQRRAGSGFLRCAFGNMGAS